jgi:beta-lactamase class A
MRRNTIAGILLCLVCLGSIGFLWRREPSLWKNRDAGLQHAFTEALEKEFQVGGAFWEGISEKRIGIALVDITVPSRPRVAEFNGDVMIYAASLPKIAILLGALVEVERGNLELDEKLRASLTRMIRESSNEDATAVLHRVGFENLAAILQSKRFRLYDPDHNGGLWVGQDYGGGEEWQRDPLHNISHGATAMQTARFYYLAATGRLLQRRLNDILLEILSRPAIEHKFVKGLEEENPEAEIYRKSGTWKQYHADSGIVVADDYSYIIAAIVQDPRGEQELQRLIRAVEATMQTFHGP